MKKLALGALFAVVACGGGNSTPPMLIDAPMDGAAACNPVAQTGCATNEKCTWVVDQVTPTEVGHIGCAPVTGTEVAVGAACLAATDTGGPPPGASGFDNCVKGSICIARVCEGICDPQMVGTASGCDAQHACGTYTSLFESGGTAVAGACDPLCNILDQTLVVDGRAACGSANPAAPNLGCYPNAFFLTGSCAPVRSDTAPPLGSNTPTKHLDRTDRVEPLVNSMGAAFKNGCAPGFLALYFENDTSMKALCTGICAPTPLNTATIGANANREFGDDSVPVKLPRSAVATAGDGLCTINKKGNGTDPENCVYLWGLFLQMDGTPNPMDTQGEKFGFCFPHNVFHFDKNNTGTLDTVFPNFKTLPVRSAATPGTFPATADDACDFVVSGLRATTCTKAQAGFFQNMAPVVPQKQMLRLNIDAPIQR